MIEVKNLTKNYGNKTAIQGLNFTLKKGEIVGLLGLNGSGKTTTIRILTGFLVPSEGEVQIDGKSNFTDPMESKKKIGYLPETPPLYEEMTVREYLDYAGKIKGLSKDVLGSEIERVSSMTNLLGVKDTVISHLSLGFRKRVGIAQALLGNPPIIIMDEPISGLDPKQILDMRNLIQGLAGKHTVLLSSHILSEVQKTCDRFIFLHQGKITHDYKSAELDIQLAKYALLEVQLSGKKKEECISYLKSIDPGVQVVETLEDSGGLTFGLKVTLPDFTDRLLDTYKQAGLKIGFFKRQTLTLERIFMDNI